MAWLVLAAVWALWVHAPASPCGEARQQQARQRLTAPDGVATVDVSTDGRLVAFVSLARLTPADDNTVEDIYVLERASGRITLETTGPAGRSSEGTSQHPRLSGDGRFLVFSTVATRLVGSSVEAVGAQVVRRDRATGAMTLVSHTPAGTPGNAWSGLPDISDDGRFVVFESRATDLVAGPDANERGSDVYLFDAADGMLRRVSIVDAGGQPALGQNATPVISGSGRFVAFSSTTAMSASAEPPDRRESRRNVFVRDLEHGVTRPVSVSRDRQGPNGDSYYPAISGDGHRVAFVSTATNLDDDMRVKRQENVYLYDDRTPALRLITRNTSGGPANGGSRHPALSGDGRYVLFSSEASNLHCTDRCGPAIDLNLVADVYRVEIATGAAERISGGPFPRESWWNASSGVAADGSGQVVAFSSREPMDDADLDHDDDLFVETLAGAPDGAAAPCEPGPGR